MKQYLNPTMDDVALECVLIQAWKKTSAYVRAHSWYSDTLGLDCTSLRLPQFIKELQHRLREPETWQPQPLEMVPAPKNQRWMYKNDEWIPDEKNINLKMRPLSHVDLQDQVISTAIMLCLSDRVETALGNPIDSVLAEENRRKILAYGHRLYCDKLDNGILRHRWGSSMLYRQYFQDYTTFLERPKVVAKEIQSVKGDYEIAIIQSDISKFYDCVRPELLWHKLRKFKANENEEEFFAFAKRVLDWRWADQSRAQRYSKDHNINGFEKIALPQGLVSAGFFANIVLCDFDKGLRSYIGKELPNSRMILRDACYYVDDLRLVLQIPVGEKEENIRGAVVTWLQSQLDLYAPGLLVAKDKTAVTVEGREKRFLVRQSGEARRIQSQVSNTFDMLRGTELIAAIEGFFHTQQRYSTDYDHCSPRDTGLLVGVPDMRDDTAARFAAGKFRRTFRSLRPLLMDERHPLEIILKEDSLKGDFDSEVALPYDLVLSKTQLDERAKFFSALLIEEWIKNPGHVRLLRIALDIYPDCDFLQQVLTILRPGWESRSLRKAKREVRIYCLAEIFRAGATETGFVFDDECLPGVIDIDRYHQTLINEATNLVEKYLCTQTKDSRFPWYLMQQVFLYLIARNAFPLKTGLIKARGGRQLSQYFKLVKFMAGECPITLEERAIFLVLINTAFNVKGFETLRSFSRLSNKFLIEVDKISPLVARLLWMHYRSLASEKLKLTAQKLGLESLPSVQNDKTLAEISSCDNNPFWDEENLLQLAYWLMGLPESDFKEHITPWRILCALEPSNRKEYMYGRIDPKSLDLKRSGDKAITLFNSPDWIESEDERKLFKIGLILRFALRGTTSFYSKYEVRKKHDKVRYVKPISHWEQQRYAGFQGREVFGPPWIPISSFTEDMLFQLLRWPGSGVPDTYISISNLQGSILTQINKLAENRSKVAATMFLRQSAPWPNTDIHLSHRQLRVGIVQSIIPNSEDFYKYKDPELSDPSFAGKRRAHLAAMIEGVNQMLRVRETHRSQTMPDGRLIDLLIFPELAIHPRDIDSLVLPFVRKHKCIVLFGQIYHPKDAQLDSPLINSCMWLIPEWSRGQGLRIRQIEQGKQNLAKQESELTPPPIGFRPVQWLIDYGWHRDLSNRPLVLSASVCLDATDLALAADLRDLSDLYIVCAFNKDVGTFDRMSESLHYHMFQGVIIVNNGQYGGSSFYMPFSDIFSRQVLHIHGQPQASIAFAEISPEKLIKRPNSLDSELPEGGWKRPPAGWFRG